MANKNTVLCSAEYEVTINDEIKMFNLANHTDFGDNREITIYRTNNGLKQSDEPAVFGVNWSCKGTVSAEEANKFANDLMKAACLANHLTALRLVCDYSIDSKPFIEAYKNREVM